MSTARRSAPRRWLVVTLCVVLVSFALLGCVYVYSAAASDRTLNAAIAETDELDPRWRLDDIEMDRAVVPDERNSGRTAIAAKHLLPENWPAWEIPDKQHDRVAENKRVVFQESFNELEPQEQLNADQVEAMRAEMKKAAAALTEARKLADMPEGRYTITYTADVISTLLPHIQEARTVGHLLGFDALLRAQDQDADGALESCRAALNAGRSVGEEPFLVSQLVRIACVSIALNRAERVLGQGEPSDAALLQLQQLLEKEEAQSLLLVGLGGERAGLDRLMEAIQTGKTSLSALGLSPIAGPTSAGTPAYPGGGRGCRMVSRLHQKPARGVAALYESSHCDCQTAFRTAIGGASEMGSEREQSTPGGALALSRDE